jgi:hypothetical protein
LAMWKQLYDWGARIVEERSLEAAAH